jgi:hypothetical protein
MSAEDIAKVIEATMKVVETWPAWKRNLLIDSAEPTSPQRPHVDNNVPAGFLDAASCGDASSGNKSDAA